MSRLVASQRAWLAPAWVREDLSRKAQALPSLDLRFAESKSLTDAATGANLVTFTRASSGTYVGSDGVLQRATTNLLLQSEDFSTTWSTSLCAVTVNTQSSPSGAQTADTLTDQNGSTGSPFALQTVALADSTTYVMSCYLKAGTKTTARVGIRAKDGTVVVANFDLSAGTTTVGNATASSIQAVGNGWYRCVAICASSTGATSQRGLVYIDTTSYTANGTGTIHLWGAQLEQSSTVGEYIPTTSTINSAPRFDHDPTTGESLGLLVEEQRTNGYVNSENLTGLVGSGATTAASVVVTPSANTNAISLTEDGTNAQHNASLAVPVTSGTAVSISIFAKLGAGSRGLIIRGLAAQFTSIVDTRFDLVNGTVAAGTGSIQRFPNSWYRCTFIATPTATSAGASIRLHLTDGANVTYQGDGASSILLYGPQVENGAFPTSYIPTTGATATRSADVASITGTNFSSWYRQDEGTVFSEFALGGVASQNKVVNFDAGAGFTDSIDMYCVSGTPRYEVYVGSVVQAQLGMGPSIGTNVATKVIGAYKANDFGATRSGGVVITDGSGTIPSTVRMGIGAQLSGNQYLNGTIRRLSYWPARLANSTLQTITQ